MSVGVGSETDPPEFVGFTHLLEHLIFTGSTNFPEDHHIEKIINKYQGEHNGVTKAFSTSFFYKLHKDGLGEFLPALADAIINPTLTKENLEKEINNVNSEISMRMTYNKHLATYKLLKKIGNPNSKLFQDGFANIDTEGTNLDRLKAQLHEFHGRYYSANIMTMVVIADVDLRDLKNQVENHFSWVKNKEVVRPLYNDTQPVVPPFLPESFGKVYYIQGFTKPSKLTLTFVCPNYKTSVGFHPLEFLSQFLNYYSESSFKQTLIKKNLITAFSDAVILDDYTSAVYTISFSLTAYGLRHTSKLIAQFFHFLDFVRKIPNKDRIFSDLARVSKFSFLFGIKSEFMDFSHTQENYFDRVERFSDTLLDYSPENLFILDHVFSQFNQTEFDQTIESIKPEKAIYIIESDQFKLDEIVRSPKESGNAPKTANLGEGKLKKAKSRKLNLKSTVPSLTPKEDTNLAIKEFLSLKRHHPMLSLGRGRLLSEYVYDETTEEIEEKRTMTKFFDKPYESVSLPYEFDFDGGRRYNYADIPAEELSSISVQALEINERYDTCQPFNTAFLDRYKMITKCHTPPSLRTERHTDRFPLQKLLDYINLENQESTPVKDDGLHTAPIFKAVFNDQESPMEKHDRLTILRDLTAYKLCLVKDFDDDDKAESPELLKQGPGLMVYHHMFRKTLQPKASITLTVESQMIIRSIMKSTVIERVHKALIMEVLCMYMVRHIEFEHRSEYTKGNDFTCHVENFRAVLGFEGLTTELETFIPKVLTSLRSLTFSQTFKGYVIENYKHRIVEIYSQFHTMSSLKLSMFYLNLALDKVFIDNSSPEKLELIRAAVQGISAEDLAAVMEHFMTDNKVFALGVGNVEDDYVVRVGERARDLLSSVSSPSLTSYDFTDFRRYIHSNFITRIEKEEHLMVRLENLDKSESNSVYLTYFRITKATRLVKLQTLIMNHFLSKVVYGHLRNKLNLGYVAQAGLRIYYHVG